MIDHRFVIFGCGALGSVAIELVTWLNYYQEGITPPRRYRELAFILGRCVLAVIAGGLAVALEADKPLLAIYVGVAAPSIIRYLAATPVNSASLPWMRGGLPPLPPGSPPVGVDNEGTRNADPGENGRDHKRLAS